MRGVPSTAADLPLSGRVPLRAGNPGGERIGRASVQARRAGSSMC